MSGKATKVAATLEMLSDGNLVLFKNKDVYHMAQWTSSSYQGSESVHYYCTLSNEGQMKVYRGIGPKGVLIWKSQRAE